MSGILRSALRTTPLRRSLRPRNVQVVQKAFYDVVSGPPKYRHSLELKFTLAFIMMFFVNCPQFFLLAACREDFRKGKEGKVRPEDL